MSDDIVTRLRYQRTNSVLCAEAASWIELYRHQIVHLWRHGQGCGAQTCGLCVEAYATYKRHYALAADDE